VSDGQEHTDWGLAGGLASPAPATNPVHEANNGQLPLLSEKGRSYKKNRDSQQE
jgi:hypothetical protein